MTKTSWSCLLTVSLIVVFNSCNPGIGRYTGTFPTDDSIIVLNATIRYLRKQFQPIVQRQTRTKSIVNIVIIGVTIGGTTGRIGSWSRRSSAANESLPLVSPTSAGFDVTNIVLLQNRLRQHSSYEVAFHYQDTSSRLLYRCIAAFAICATEMISLFIIIIVLYIQTSNLHWVCASTLVQNPITANANHNNILRPLIKLSQCTAITN